MKRTAHNVAIRPKDKGQKFCGEFGQCWQEFVDDYDQIAEDYNLNEEQQLGYMHNQLSKAAHCSYLGKVKPNVETYAEAKGLIRKEIQLGSALGTRQKSSQ